MAGLLENAPSDDTLKYAQCVVSDVIKLKKECEGRTAINNGLTMDHYIHIYQIAVEQQKLDYLCQINDKLQELQQCVGVNLEAICGAIDNVETSNMSISIDGVKK